MTMTPAATAPAAAIPPRTAPTTAPDEAAPPAAAAAAAPAAAEKPSKLQGLLGKVGLAQNSSVLNYAAMAQTGMVVNYALTGIGQSIRGAWSLLRGNATLQAPPPAAE